MNLSDGGDTGVVEGREGGACSVAIFVSSSCGLLFVCLSSVAMGIEMRVLLAEGSLEYGLTFLRHTDL